MSEQKVWVEKMPESCSDCPCCNYGNDGEKNYTCNLMKYGYDALTDGNLINKIPEGCPLHTTGELVKEVCEKISIELENETETYCEIRQCSSPHYQGDFVWFNYVKFRKFIDQIQKEYKK